MGIPAHAPTLKVASHTPVVDGDGIIPSSTCLHECNMGYQTTYSVGCTSKSAQVRASAGRKDSKYLLNILWEAWRGGILQFTERSDSEPGTASPLFQGSTCVSRWGNPGMCCLRCDKIGVLRLG